MVVLWEGNGTPLQCSCLDNPMDGGAWRAAICGVTQSRTLLKWLSMVVLSVDPSSKIWDVPPQGAHSLPFVCLGMWPESCVHIFLDSASYNGLWIKARPRFWHNIVKLLTNWSKPCGSNLKHVVPSSYQTHAKPELASHSSIAFSHSFIVKMKSKIGRRYVGINSSALSFLYSPALTSIHDHWKNRSLD